MNDVVMYVCCNSGLNSSIYHHIFRKVVLKLLAWMQTSAYVERKLLVQVKDFLSIKRDSLKTKNKWMSLYSHTNLVLPPQNQYVQENHVFFFFIQVIILM